jgi:hypothetical protein
MRRLPRASAAAVLLMLTACASAPTTGPGSARSGTVAIRAQRGDTLHIIEHHIRPERRQQFEEFVEQMLWPAFQRAAGTSPSLHEALQRTRFIAAAAAAEDGTWTYAFVLDPAVKGESYNVFEILRTAYGDEEALRQYHRYTETWARGFTARTYIQQSNPQSP